MRIARISIALFLVAFGILGCLGLWSDLFSGHHSAGHVQSSIDNLSLALHSLLLFAGLIGVLLLYSKNSRGGTES